MEWYIPITILSGVAMIIFSTSRLWISVSEEIERMERNASNYAESIIMQKINQLRRLNLALILQYASAFFFVIASVIGGITNWYQSADSSTTATLIIMFIGALLLIAALLYLVIYSTKAVQIRKEQFKIDD
jgi:uncharacterized membrane protein YqhA